MLLSSMLATTPNVFLIFGNLFTYLQFIGHKLFAVEALAEIVRCWITLVCEMLSSPDTLRVQLSWFASITWETTSESKVLPDIAWLSRFLQCKQNF